MRIATISKRAAAVATAGVLAFGLAACGDDGGDSDNDSDSSSETTDSGESTDGGDSEWAQGEPDQMLEDVRSSMDAVTALRLQGTVSENGEETKINLALNTDGNCEGTIGVQGGQAQLISVDGSDYLKGDEAFWKAAAGADGSESDAQAIITLLGDKWAKIPSESGGFSEVCDLDSFLDDFLSDTDGSNVTVGDTGEVDGTPTVELTGDDDSGNPTTAVVSTVEDEHYIFELRVDSGDEPGQINFSEFNETVKAEAPPEEDVLDMSNLGA